VLFRCSYIYRWQLLL